MSPSSAKNIEGDGDGADVIQNNRLAKKSFTGVKVKKHVAQIINMRKVTAHSIAYIACQVSRSARLMTEMMTKLAGSIRALFCHLMAVR